MSDNSLGAVTPGGAPVVATAPELEAYLRSLASQAAGRDAGPQPPLIVVPEKDAEER